MRETERRIQLYKAKLPHMRERVMAALALLLVSAIMMVSASYAWLVLSINPEVKGINTTIAANGNLEIAMAGRMDDNGKLLFPADSAVGDGMLGIVDKNLTWGNLVNLGDPTYGLETIILRPAELNENKLKTSPLFAATYGADGRVEQLFSDFGYTYAYNGLFKTKDQIIKEGGDATKFKEYGVRAVSSLKYGFSEAPTVRQEALAELLKTMESSSNDAKTTMQQITESTEGKAALQSLMDLAGRYTAAEVDATLGGSDKNTSVSPDDIENLSYLFGQLLLVTEKSANALADIYNFEIYMRTDSRTGFVDGAFFLDSNNSWATIVNKLDAKNNAGETIIQTKVKQELRQLKTDYQTLKNSKAQIDACAGKNNIVYTNVENAENVVAIAGALSPVFDINSVTINNQTISQLKSSIKSNIFGAVSLLNKLTNKPDVKIAAGILPRLDKFTGAKISGTYSFTIPANITTLNVKDAKVSTTAEEPFVLVTESERAQGSTTDFKGDTAQAAETYGLVLDFWVRTNAANSKLTLEGAPVYVTREETVTAIIDGTEKELYKVEVYLTEYGQLASSETENVEEFEAYIDGGQYVLYDRSTQITQGELCATDSVSVKSQSLLTETVSELVGYNGVNRVWDNMINNPDGGYDYSNSTTMGSGSCYVFYPKSADDQAKSIQLLKNLYVAFIGQDKDGKTILLGKGVLDTDHAIEQSGKVTVPLVCHYDNASTTIINADGQEETIYYITDLDANTPTLVTALVYLDGKNLSNDQVLSTNDIQGHLNIQFGTTVGLSAMEDSVLREEQCNITATMTEKDGSALHIGDDITASVDVRTKRIEIKVEGVTPSRVTAYFQRVINSTQGIRQNEIVFKDEDGDGTWTAEYTFVNAGDYILREVVLDGVTYDLDSSPIEYTLAGYAINNLYFGEGRTTSTGYGILQNGSTYVTTDQRFTAEVILNFTRSGGDPASIKGAFVHQATGNRVTVTFSKDSGNQWSGIAAFTTSGEYRLERLEIDKDTIGVPDDKILSLNLYLGVTANVYSNKTEIGLSDEVKSSKVTMSMSVVADNDTQFKNMPPIKLTYSRNGLISDAEVLTANLRWNGQMYEGEFEITQSGTYSFYQAEVTINGNTNRLGVARTSPVITVTNVDEVPVYSSNINLGDSVFALNNDAAFSITLEDASSATVDAKVVDKDGNAYYIRGTVWDNENDTQTFTFLLPMVGDPLSQSGEWTLEELYLTNVFDSNGVLYNGLTAYGPLPAGAADLGDREPYTVADGYYNRWWTWTQADLFVGDTSAFTVTVASDVQIEILSTGNINYGATDANNITGLFGQSYDLSTDNKGYVDVKVAINDIPIYEAMGSHPTLKLDYKLDTANSFTKGANMSTSKYGSGYTIASGDVSKLAGTGLVDGLVNFGDDNVEYLGKGIYRLTTNEKLSVAGIYVPAGNLTVQVSGLKDPFTESTSTAPTFTVWSKNPTVEVTGVSSSHSSVRIYKKSNPANAGADMFRNGANLTWSDWNKKNSSSEATVYMYVGAKSGSFDQEPATLYQSKVSLKLGNISSNFTSASMTFSHNVSSVGDFSAVYNFTPSGLTQSVGIGGYEQGSKSLLGVDTYPVLYPMGSKTVEQIVIVYNGVNITMTVNPITINNPLSPTTVHYVVQGEGSGYTVPGDVYPSDGSTVVLPGSQTWTSEGKRNEVSGGYTKADGSKTYQGYKYSRTETSTNSCTGATTNTNYYYQWTMVETKYESVGVIYSWTNTHTIVGWLVNGVQYAPGTTVSVNGDTTITAVIETTKGAETSVEDVAVYYEWDFTQGSESTSKTGDDWADLNTTDVIGDETNTTPFKDSW